jgi:hypothetical protein
MTALIIVWALFLLLGICYSVILFFDLIELKETIENFNQQEYGADFYHHQTKMESQTFEALVLCIICLVFLGFALIQVIYSGMQLRKIKNQRES